MQWLDDYRRKLRTADEAVRLIKSGGSMTTAASSAPRTRRFD